MQLKEEIIRDVAVLHLKGDLMDVPDTRKLREKVQSFLDEDFKNIVVDLGGVRWINSSGLGALISAFTSVRNKGGDLRLANITEKLESLFLVTQLVKVFKTYESVDRAVASFRGSKA
jgi:anti-sigma B factor antagonist